VQFPQSPEPYTQAVSNFKNDKNNKATPGASAPDLDAVVIGAGLAGLACARELTAAGLSVHVLEAAEAVFARMS